MMRKIISIVLIMTVMCALLSSCVNKNEESQMFTIPQEWFDNFDGNEMTLDDVRNLAEKGDSLMFEDLRSYRGMNVSSSMFSYIMVYGVEGGYRLIVNSEESIGKPSRADLESIWESGGSGIDIRYNDVGEFIHTNPSHPALTVNENPIWNIYQE